MIKLHDEIASILKHGPMHIEKIVSEVNERKNYKKRDGSVVTRKQVSGRISKYNHMFERVSMGTYKKRIN